VGLVRAGEQGKGLGGGEEIRRQADPKAKQSAATEINDLINMIFKCMEQ